MRNVDDKDYDEVYRKIWLHNAGIVYAPPSLQGVIRALEVYKIKVGEPGGSIIDQVYSRTLPSDKLDELERQLDIKARFIEILISMNREVGMGIGDGLSKIIFPDGKTSAQGFIFEGDLKKFFEDPEVLKVLQKPLLEKGLDLRVIKDKLEKFIAETLEDHLSEKKESSSKFSP